MSVNEELHNIDRPLEGSKYNDLELDEFMVFCILDTACPYEMVCKVFDALRESGMTTRKGIMHWREDMIEKTLKKAGYRFPKQHASRIKKFGYSSIDLRTATRKELVDDITGIGMKLASMFLRNTRGKDYAVIDVHTERWLMANLMKTEVVKATLRCLIGCNIGEASGLLIGRLYGLDIMSTIIIAVGLAFTVGYLAKIMPLRSAVKITLGGDTMSIASMEFAENTLALLIPGFMASFIFDSIFWIGFGMMLAVGFFASYPVMNWLMKNEKCGCDMVGKKK